MVTIQETNSSPSASELWALCLVSGLLAALLSWVAFKGEGATADLPVTMFVIQMTSGLFLATTMAFAVAAILAQRAREVTWVFVTLISVAFSLFLLALWAGFYALAQESLQREMFVTWFVMCGIALFFGVLFSWAAFSFFLPKR